MCPVFFFGTLALGDVPADAAVTDEPPVLVENRHAGHRDVALAAVRGCSSKFEVAKRQVRIERRAVLPPGLFVGLQVGHLPARLPDFGAVAGASARRFENSWRVKRCCSSDSQYTSKEN